MGKIKKIQGFNQGKFEKIQGNIRLRAPVVRRNLWRSVAVGEIALVVVDEGLVDQAVAPGSGIAA